jgi:hypothetical protein
MVHGVITDPESTLPPAVVAQIGDGTAMYIGPYGRVMALQRFGTGRQGDNRTSMYYTVARDGHTALSEELGVPRTTQLHVAGTDPHSRIAAWLAEDLASCGWAGETLAAAAVCDKLGVRPIFQHPALPRLRGSQDRHPDLAAQAEEITNDHERAADEQAGRLPLVVLGDALHAVPPWTGSGGNLAIKDAAEIAAAVREFMLKSQATAGGEGGGASAGGSPTSDIDRTALLTALRVKEREAAERAVEVVEQSENRTREMAERDSIADPADITPRMLAGGSRLGVALVWLLKQAYRWNL